MTIFITTASWSRVSRVKWKILARYVAVCWAMSCVTKRSALLYCPAVTDLTNPISVADKWSVAVSLIFELHPFSVLLTVTVIDKHIQPMEKPTPNKRGFVVGYLRQSQIIPLCLRVIVWLTSERISCVSSLIGFFYELGHMLEIDCIFTDPFLCPSLEEKF